MACGGVFPPPGAIELPYLFGGSIRASEELLEEPSGTGPPISRDVVKIRKWTWTWSVARYFGGHNIHRLSPLAQGWSGAGVAWGMDAVRVGVRVIGIRMHSADQWVPPDLSMLGTKTSGGTDKPLISRDGKVWVWRSLVPAGIRFSQQRIQMRRPKGKTMIRVWCPPGPQRC